MKLPNSANIFLKRTTARKTIVTFAECLFWTLQDSKAITSNTNVTRISIATHMEKMWILKLKRLGNKAVLLWFPTNPGQVVMDDLMKMEPDSDPLAIQTSDNADAEEGKLLSEEGNLLDFHFTAIKTECIDHRYDVKSEMTYEEVEVSVDFPIMKSEAEENSCELDEVSDEGKPEVTGEENEVLAESCNGCNQDGTWVRHICYRNKW
ncbi:uncharacterized protein [Periplaneta americana]|uniref:uncharacterized protein isoform X8 n=1 Tax=Periplaneta americana TaxID=6978 RepID=UPI0037E7D23A